MVLDRSVLPKRKRNRLGNFDYGQEGYYFITLCTRNMRHIFEIEPVRNDLCVVPYDAAQTTVLQNRIIYKWIKETENKFPNIKFDKCVIMPNHLHFIIIIKERHAGRSLPDIMRFFKTMTTNEYIRYIKEGKLPPLYKKLWQKSYYDHIIRNKDDYKEVWNYIENNPQKWLLKEE